MKIGRISYANTEPFFYKWGDTEFEMVYGSPAGLAEEAKRGELIAGPLPLVECWALEKEFEPLGNWCIAAQNRCRSVFVLSKVPFSELDHVTIGATKDSATSVRLCEILIREKYGNDARIRKGLQIEDAAWLVIGDQAMQLVASPAMRDWPYVTDLATEWWTWKQLPFVFARWVVRRDTPGAVRKKLERMIETSLKQTKETMPDLAIEVAARMNLPVDSLVSYFNGMIYRMDKDAHESEAQFKKLLAEGTVSGRRAVAHH